jgi:AcrR family transcriptional regulator
MPRRVPDSRFQDLIDAATGVFIAQGYRHTQMSDIAEAVGLAKGTIYLYVESRTPSTSCAPLTRRAHPAAAESAGPPARGRTSVAQQRLAEQPASPTLVVTLRRHGRRRDATELARILGELL